MSLRLALVAALGLASAAAPLGWIISDRYEADSRFCVACHLAPDQPLHQAKFERFRRGAVRDLAGAHRRADAEFACIACHGGASFPNKLRVKTVALRDAGLYLLGAFEEPRSMKHPLWDEDCATCHADYAPTRDDAFHAFDAHNVDFEYRCVDCHRAHDMAVDPELWFTNPSVIGPVCRNCHEEF